LTLPVSIVEALELPYFMDIKANLADDSDIKTGDFYEGGTVVLDEIL
jgi:hypothetical protein